jgi:ribosome biogenesis GTPase
LRFDTRPLHRLGWSPGLAALFENLASDGDVPARVVAELGRSFTLETPDGPLVAEVSGHLRHAASAAIELPAIGDWVVLRPGEGATITAVLPRSGALTRKVAGVVTSGQVIAANVDLVLVVAALSTHIRPRSIERYLTMAWESGAEPIVVLTKVDLAEDVEASVAAVVDVAVGVDVHAVSAVTGHGMDHIAARLHEGVTAVLVGPSGVGKSTLINWLLGGHSIKTGEVRDDQRGRHTTTHRELHHLASGGMVIDTPGLRELQLWHADEGFSKTFSDVEDLVSQCRFRDCGHRGEPGCAVAAALASGALSHDRFAGYKKLERELAVLARRSDGRARAEAHRRIRNFSRAINARPSKRDV